MVCPHHECVADGVSAAKHERLSLLVQAARGGNCLVAIGFGVHQAVVNGHIVREKFELFWIIGEVIDLVEKQL